MVLKLDGEWYKGGFVCKHGQRVGCSSGSKDWVVQCLLFHCMGSLGGRRVNETISTTTVFFP